MIICDRCQKQIKPDTCYPESRFEIVDYTAGLVACDECNDKLRQGYRIIDKELEAEREMRNKKWRDEWRRNYKPER